MTRQRWRESVKEEEHLTVGWLKKRASPPFFLRGIGIVVSDSCLNGAATVMERMPFDNLIPTPHNQGC
jgi:hypothetical protein